MSTDTLSANDELDLTGDSAVEIFEDVWQITEVETIDSESDNGTGKYVALV